MNKIKNTFVIVGVISVIFVLIPLITGMVVSGKSFPWINDQSQWIGFWGNYLGALIGGVLSGAVAVYVMKQTIKYENAERDRKEKIEFCLKLNEYIMEYGSKIGNYSLDVYKKSIDEVEQIKEYNEIIRLSGIINSLLYSRMEEKEYKGIEEFVNISQKLIHKVENLKKEPDADERTVVDIANELRDYSADFLKMNY